LQWPQELKNQWTLLYFYPKDDTPGCTKQACSYRDNISEFTKRGVKVFGVSLDDLTSHNAFAEKFSLNFPLIYDKDKALSTFLGVYGEQEWNGNKYMGLSRDTFLIDPNGVVQREWRKVNPLATVGETLQAVVELVK
jgi:peroxiredoxin Q/BCP